jgi:hypothetical protein
MVVFTPDRIFRGGPERAVRLRSTRSNRKAGGRGRVPEGPPVLPEILKMIGINPGRTIKSRPGSLHGKAFFPCVPVRFSGVIVTWPAISRRGRPSTWKAAVDRLVSPDRCRRRAFEGLLDRPAISLLKRFAHLGQVLILLLSLLFLGQGFGGSEFRVFGIAVNSYATSRIGRLSNHNIDKWKTCILYIICIN